MLLGRSCSKTNEIRPELEWQKELCKSGVGALLRFRLPTCTLSTEERELKASTPGLGQGQGRQSSAHVCQTGIGMLLIFVFPS